MKALTRNFPDDGAEDARTFAQAVQARLAEEILSGRLAPGTRLRLQSLCETYEVSMSPLREALSGLAGRRLVAQEGQRGFRVATATPDDLRDVTETRIHIETLALRLTRSNNAVAVSFATEAGHFQGAGLPTIVCGPGSIDMAHKPDEFVDEAQLVACLEFLERLAEDLSR